MLVPEYLRIVIIGLFIRIVVCQSAVGLSNEEIVARFNSTKGTADRTKSVGNMRDHLDSDPASNSTRVSPESPSVIIELNQGSNKTQPPSTLRRTSKFYPFNALADSIQYAASQCTIRCMDWNNDTRRARCRPWDIKCLCASEIFNDDWTECVSDNCHGADVQEIVVAAIRTCVVEGSSYRISHPIRIKLFEAIERSYSPSGF